MEEAQNNRNAGAGADRSGASHNTPYQEMKLADRYGGMMAETDAATVHQYNFLHQNLTAQQLTKLIGLVNNKEGFMVTYPERQGLDCIVNWLNWTEWTIKPDGTLHVRNLKPPPFPVDTPREGQIR